jgi:PE-PPE domain
MPRSGKTRVNKLAMTFAAAGVATSVAGVAATQPASISSLIDLTALIVVGSSTNPTGAGVADFFGGKFTDPIYTGPNRDDIVYVNFLTGPLGIEQALDANAGEPNAILASGWGAANASLLLLGDQPDLDQTVVILDNDVARPDGGFGTRYPWFALIGVNPIPTPSDVPARAAVNIGYEYDYNSNAPADVLNPLAAINSLVAYLDTRLNQSELDLPVNADGSPSVTCQANTCAITASGAVLDCPDARCSSPGDRITAYVTTRNNTTYVTYTTEELPLTRLIHGVFGDPLAELTGPLLKLAVDSAYYGGNPIPQDPSAYHPARLFPPPDEVLSTAAKLPGAIQQGLAAVSSSDQSMKTTDTTEAATAIQGADAPHEFSDKRTLQTNDKGALQTNVVRDSLKAVPGSPAGADTPTGDSKTLVTEQGSTTEVQQTNVDSTDSGTVTGGTDRSDDSPADGSQADGADTAA